ncbi:hypothetical protein CTU88_27265 [Streptomyces sp. JV178]|nr:hypothetical protein CTU88_27265 [Streptomyces sp. JV178]
MPSVVGLLEERERTALARVEELHAEMERLRVAVTESEEAARRAVAAREDVVEVLATSPVWAEVEIVLVEEDAAGGGEGPGPRSDGQNCVRPPSGAVAR